MDFKSFASAIAQIAEEKGIAPEKVIESLEQALAAAYKKDYGKKGQKILAKFNSKTSSHLKRLQTFHPSYKIF